MSFGSLSTTFTQVPKTAFQAADSRLCFLFIVPSWRSVRERECVCVREKEIESVGVCVCVCVWVREKSVWVSEGEREEWAESLSSLQKVSSPAFSSNLRVAVHLDFEGWQGLEI